MENKDQLTEIANQDVTEQQQENEALTNFVAEVDDQGELKEESTTAADKIEKLSLTVAENMVAGGAQGLLTVFGMVFSCQITISAPEMQDLSKSIAPLVVKYTDDIENLPPWLKSLLKYKVELIALKGLCLFGLSITMQVREQKRARIEAAKQQVTEKEAVADGNQ